MTLQTEASPDLSIPGLIAILHERVQSFPAVSPAKDVGIDNILASQAKVEEILSNIRFLRNARAPIHVFPDEIFTRVFKFVGIMNCEAGPNNYAARTQIMTRAAGKSPVQWETDTTLLLASTCRRWRSIALHSPALWTHFGFDPQHKGRHPEEYFRKCLSRSREEFLKVEMHTPSSEWMEIMSPHASRIQELNLVADAGALGSDSMNWSTPNLNTLRVYAFRGFRMGPPHLPLLFEGHLPKLRSMLLSDAVSWSPGVLKNLTSLELRNVPRWHLVHPTVGAFLELLAENPRLEALTVSHHGPVQADSNPQNPVALPRLSTLILENTYSHLILSLLDTPPSVNIDIYDTFCYIEDIGVEVPWGDPDLYNPCVIIPEDVSYIGTLNGVRSLVFQPDSSKVSLEFHNDTAHAVKIHESESRGWTDMYARCFRGFGKLSFVSGIQSFAIINSPNRSRPNSIRDISKSDWEFLLHKLHKLKHLTLRGVDVYPLFQALSSAGEEKGLACPELDTINLILEVNSSDTFEEELLKMLRLSLYDFYLTPEVFAEWELKFAHFGVDCVSVTRYEPW